MEGLQDGSTRGPSDFQKDSDPVPSSGLFLWEPLGPGAPGHACTFPYLFPPPRPPPSRPELSSVEVPGAAPSTLLPLPGPHPPPSGVSLAPQQRAGPSEWRDIWGLLLVF